MKKKFLLFFCLVSISTLTAQKFPEHPTDYARNLGHAVLANLDFGFQLPASDLAERFGSNGVIGLSCDWISQNNFILEASGQFYFSNIVHDDPLAILRTPDGYIIGNDRLVASVVLRERGFYLGGNVGKLFPVGGIRSGIRVTVGAGTTRHWIRVQDDNNTVAQLTGDYLKGYDRLTGGPALQQFLGWQHLGINRRSNWILGLEFQQGFTHSLRDWDFNDMKKLDGQRIDLRIGIRASWTIPFYLGQSDQIYY